MQINWYIQMTALWHCPWERLLHYICRMYVDDCTLYRQIDSSADVIALQNAYGLSLLEEWEKKWKMRLNI